jgi:hypothetical protein
MIGPMIDLAVREIGRDEWTRLTVEFADLSLMQSWEYAEAKARAGRWRVERGVFLDGGHPVGLAQVLVRPLPAGIPGGLAWINRGPLWRRNGEAGDPVRLSAMMEALRAHYAGAKSMYLRVAPPLEELEAVSPPGFSSAGTAGWASAVLDLTPPVETLRKGLRQKWRNCLNKAERCGLEVRSGEDDTLFAAFLDGHRRLTDGGGFATTVTVELLQALQSLLPEDRTMTAFLAYEEATTVASVLVARYGDTAEYLAGNVWDAGRRLNAGQLLLWRAVGAMKERGCRCFDLGGLDADLTPPGIRHFKEGLSAAPYRLAPELEALGGGPLGRLVRWRVRRAREAG